MNPKALIMNRVSNSKFNQKSVDVNQLLDLLDIAVYAPNHKMREPWRFVLIKDDAKEKFIERYVNELDESLRIDQKNLISKVFSAPVVISIVMPKTGQERDDLEDMQANAAMIQNFLLLSTEAGFSTFWKTPAYIESSPFRKTLGVLDHEIVIGLIMIGYSDVIPPAKPRKSARSKTIIYS